jgi:hypothetical protein
MTVPDRPFSQDHRVFDPEVTHAMSVAFDELCQALQVSEAASREREIIATRIVDVARGGVTNTDVIVKRVLKEAETDAG